ncbi:glycosyltransferase family 4 protein [Candidatus Acetothermia bacterium]|nr:glycosyltransferase family 4 protein [Candidatus Acetothermia bacterium]MBI3460539.1 glycosyltransferase family 4 protein [Candidatus Acetothermia bacterium]MBI3658882.1 glycosyltransferase family 4 protein [Candidatus Acetothermia bacterium]
MRVCLYLEAPDWVSKSGIKRAYDHHLKAIEAAGIEVVSDPETDNYDLLHLHFFGPKSLLYANRAKKAGRKVVVHAHSIGAHDFQNSFTLVNPISPLYEMYLHFFYRQSDCIFTCSEFAKAQLDAIDLGRPVAVVNNGIDRERFKFDGQQRGRAREQFGLQRFTVFCGGNLIPRKGVKDFIEVARALPEFDFIWYGQLWSKLFTFYPAMHRAIERRPANVQFPGFVNDVVSAFCAGDAFFFPSYTENQPMVLLEVASLGKPLVVRDIPEYQGWLTHGLNCFKADSAENFARLLHRIATDSALYSKLSEGAEQLAAAHSLTHVGRRLRTLYEQVLSGTLGVAKDSSLLTDSKR